MIRYRGRKATLFRTRLVNTPRFI